MSTVTDADIKTNVKAIANVIVPMIYDEIAEISKAEHKLGLCASAYPPNLITKAEYLNPTKKAPVSQAAPVAAPTTSKFALLKNKPADKKKEVKSEEKKKPRVKKVGPVGLKALKTITKYKLYLMQIQIEKELYELVEETKLTALTKETARIEAYNAAIDKKKLGLLYWSANTKISTLGKHEGNVVDAALPEFIKYFMNTNSDTVNPSTYVSASEFIASKELLIFRQLAHAIARFAAVDTTIAISDSLIYCILYTESQYVSPIDEEFLKMMRTESLHACLVPKKKGTGTKGAPKKKSENAIQEPDVPEDNEDNEDDE